MIQAESLTPKNNKFDGILCKKIVFSIFFFSVYSMFILFSVIVMLLL